MEIAIDLLMGLPGRGANSPENGQGHNGQGHNGQGDSGQGPVRAWHKLHTRLASTHAARANAAGHDSRFPVLAGGFADWGVQRTSGYASRAVNRTDSADGKIHAGMGEVVTGNLNVGCRGPK